MLEQEPRPFRPQHLARRGCLVLAIPALLLGLLLTALVGLGMLVETPEAFLLAVVVATATTVPYTLLLLWVDRNEKEPPGLVVATFLWGAVVATMVSGLFNDAMGSVALDLTGDELAANVITASLAAPFIEELTKGLALLGIFIAFRRQLDNVLDGIVYGALIGMGFAWFENITYYVDIGTSEGLEQIFALGWVRGVLGGVATHATYTALTGLGFGIARVLRRGAGRWFLVPIFLAASMFAHFAWNTFVGLFVIDETDAATTLLVSLPAATVVLNGPFLLLILVVITFAWRHENKVIVEHLAGECPPDVLAALVPARRRSWDGFKLFFSRGPAAWWRRRRFEQALIRLAFVKWHHRHDGATWSLGEDREVVRLRARVRALWG